MVSCNRSKEAKEAKEARLELLNSAAHLSSLSYSVEVKRYMVIHKTNTISIKSLDSLKVISDKKCNNIMLSVVEKIK
jgi:hypothetical protein